MNALLHHIFKFYRNVGKKDTFRVIAGPRGFDRQIIKMSSKVWEFWSDRDYASDEVLIRYVRDPLIPVGI